MFFDMGHHESGTCCDAQDFGTFLRQTIADGSYVGWLVENPKKEVIARWTDHLEYHSSPADPAPRRPIIVNMYTEPHTGERYRGIDEGMIDWCTGRICTVLLHASEAGRSLLSRWALGDQ
jgi:hypothetical protein